MGRPEYEYLPAQTDREMSNGLPPPSYDDALASSSSQIATRPTTIQPESQPSIASSVATRYPTTTSSSGLRKPIAIPATTPALGSPFLRAYPPSLENFQISRELFLHFLDDLNRVAVANPPLAVLGLAGQIVGFVPLATAQIVGASVQAAATAGTVAVSKGRTELFLRDANRTIFAPRGLNVEIAKLNALAKLADIPILDSDGKLDKRATLLAPIEQDDVSGTQSLTGQQRRLQAMEPYVAHLDIEPLPEIETPSNPLSKWSKAASERQRKKGEEKNIKSRGKASEKFHKEMAKLDEEFAKEMQKLDKEEAKARKEKEPEKVEKELRKVEKEREKEVREYGKEQAKIGKDRIKDDKEESGMKKILWLMIRNLDAESGVSENEDVPEDVVR